MQWSKIGIKLIAIMLITGSCIEPFIPEVSDYVNTLFIEAVVTDNPSIPHQVVISRTVPIATQENPNPDTGFGGPGYENVSGANVSVECDDGYLYQFFEEALGRYYDSGGSLVLEEGKQYKLVIITSDGNQFESSFESYQTSPSVDSITYKAVNEKTSEAGISSMGLRFYANTANDVDEPLYVRYIMEETYEYFAPFFSMYKWDGSELIEYMNDTLLVCYKTESIPGIYASSSEGITGNRVANAPLHFVSQFGDKLIMTYSLLSYQLSINKSAYRFWEELERLLFETGGLYETQPFRINGNVRCVSNPDVNVMGVFEVAGVSTSRIFVPHPTEFIVYPMYCMLDTVGTENFPWSDLQPGSYITEGDPGEYFTSEAACYDCRERGGVIEKPPFWIK